MLFIPFSNICHSSSTANTCSRNELLANLDLEDTGIPALERHIHNLTAPLRQKFVKAFLEQLSGLAKTINMALSEASELPMADRALFREMFHTKVDVCLREVRAAVPSLIS